MGELILMNLCQPALGGASFFETQCTNNTALHYDPKCAPATICDIMLPSLQHAISKFAEIMCSKQKI